MSGLARTDSFNLAEATLMVGPMADVFSLTPEIHSLGLVKNVQMTANPSFTELMQGVTNTVVFSVNTGNEIMCSAEVYEYTLRNIAYAAGLEASGAAFDPSTAPVLLNANLAAADLSLVVAGTGNLTGFAVGDWIALQNGANADNVFVAPITAIAATTRTITWDAAFKLPVGVTWDKVTTQLYKVQSVNVGTDTGSNLLGIKITARLPATNKPVTLIFPKARVQRGLTMAFTSGNFGSLPFEFKPYALLPTDGFYSKFKQNASGAIFAG